MLGAIIGDIVGSRFEFNNTSDYGFALFDVKSSFTDDTICTVAIADALMNGTDYGESLRLWCNKYPNPMGGYGGGFASWLASDNPQPYNSFGNGAAMRVSPVGWWFSSLDEVEREAAKTAMPTHNHPEGIKGAVATASAVFIARKFGKWEMLRAAREYYPTWKEPLLGQNKFDETCQNTMPVVFGILNKAKDFEDAIRLSVAVGGDSDTIGAIVGGIAEAVWGVPADLRSIAETFLPKLIKGTVNRFNELVGQKNDEKE